MKSRQRFSETLIRVRAENLEAYTVDDIVTHLGDTLYPEGYGDGSTRRQVFHKRPGTFTWNRVQLQGTLEENGIHTGHELWLQYAKPEPAVNAAATHSHIGHSKKLVHKRAIETHRITPEVTSWTHNVDTQAAGQRFTEIVTDHFQNGGSVTPGTGHTFAFSLIPALTGVVLWFMTQNVYTLAITAVTPLIFLIQHILSRLTSRPKTIHRPVMRELFRQKVDIERSHPTLGELMKSVRNNRHTLWAKTLHEGLVLRVGKQNTPHAYVEVMAQAFTANLKRAGWEFEDLFASKHSRRLKKYINKNAHLFQKRKWPFLLEIGPGEIVACISQNPQHSDPISHIHRLVMQAALLYPPSQLAIVTRIQKHPYVDRFRWLPHHVFLTHTHQMPVQFPNQKGFILCVVEEDDVDQMRHILYESGHAGAILFIPKQRNRILKACTKILKYGPQNTVTVRSPAASDQLVHLCDDDQLQVSDTDMVRFGYLIAPSVESSFTRAPRTDSTSGIKTGNGVPFKTRHGIEETHKFEDRQPPVLALEQITALVSADSTQPVVKKMTPAAATCIAMVGYYPDRKPVNIDLVNNGPHMLVAGTTGSGKSEFLQTLLIAYAAHYSPEDLAYLLIDFKGGATFFMLAQLPHTQGLVTDISDNTPQRLFAFIEAEMAKRENKFFTAQAQHYTEYRYLNPDQKLPRLLIVIDEYATLIEHYPDSQQILEQLAARGRSLGLHLILATQRPQGIVSAQLKANLGLKAVFRVQDQAESVLIMNSGGAEKLPNPSVGHGFIQVGENPPQRGHIASLIPAPSLREQLEICEWENRIGWQILKKRHRQNDPYTSDSSEEKSTLLQIRTYRKELIARICHQWEKQHLQVPNMWIPALEQSIPFIETLHQVETMKPAKNLKTSLPAIPIGIRDQPRQQIQQVFSFDPEYDGHCYVTGPARSGKTFLLRHIHTYLKTQNYVVQHIAPRTEQEFDAQLEMLEQSSGPVCVMIDDFDRLQDAYEFSPGLNNAFRRLLQYIQYSSHTACTFVISFSDGFTLNRRMNARFRLRLKLSGQIPGRAVRIDELGDVEENFETIQLFEPQREPDAAMVA